jgi:hypothetical protein
MDTHLILPALFPLRYDDRLVIHGVTVATRQRGDMPNYFSLGPFIESCLVSLVQHNMSIETRQHSVSDNMVRNSRRPNHRFRLDLQELEYTIHFSGAIATQIFIMDAEVLVRSNFHTQLFYNLMIAGPRHGRGRNVTGLNVRQIGRDVCSWVPDDVDNSQRCSACEMSENLITKHILGAIDEDVFTQYPTRGSLKSPGRSKKGRNSVSADAQGKLP